MGMCTCTAKTSLEIFINETWNESDVTKISPDAYYAFFKRYVDENKDIENIDEQDQQIYSVIFHSYSNREFFYHIKSDLLYLAKNGKLPIVMLSLIFFNKFVSTQSLLKNIDRLFMIVKYWFKIEADILTDKDFFSEVLEIYIYICSQQTLKNISKLEIKDESFIKDQDILSKVYDKKYRDLLIKRLLEYDDFFLLSTFINENIEKLCHSAIRDELKNIYFENQH